MRISRIYNNNVVLTVDHYGKESVMIGRGIAFGKRKGLFFRWLITCTMRWFVRVMEFGWSIRLPRR